MKLQHAAGERTAPKWTLATLSAALLATSPVRAVDVEHAPLPEPYRSAAMLGRGGAGVAMADYEDALFVNPGGLALFDPPPLTKTMMVRIPTFEENINRKPDDGLFKRIAIASTMAETSKSSVELYREGVSFDADPIELAQSVIGKNLHVGAAHFTGAAFRRIAFGAFSSARADAQIKKNVAFGGLETATARADAYAGVAAGAGHDVIPDRLFVGATFRYFERGEGIETLTIDSDIAAMKQKVADGEAFRRGTCRALDVGIMARTAKASAASGNARLWGGLVLRDINSATVRGDAFLPEPTADVGIGGEAAIYTYFLRLFVDWKDVARTYDGIEDFSRLRAGAELLLTGTLGLQGGVYEGYPTGGLSLDLVLLRLEVGTYAEEMGKRAGSRRDERYFGRVTVGL